MKRNLSFYILILIVSIAVLFPKSIVAKAEMVSTNNGMIFDTSTGIITEYKGNESNLIIPDTINNILVTGIGDYLFRANFDLESIILPSSINYIGDNAFSMCDGLESINISKNVKTIGHSAFRGCLNLKSINIDEENPNYKSVDGVLYDKNLTTIICYPPEISETVFFVPKTVTKISDFTFAFCFNLKSIIIPEGVSEIGWYAFDSCNNIATINIPKSVVSIGPRAFFGCANISSINIDKENNYYSVFDGVLYNKNLTTLLFYPPRKTDVSFDIPNSVSDIDDGTFSASVEILQSIKIPEGLASFSHGLFDQCYNLKTIFVPKDWALIDSVRSEKLKKYTEVVLYIPVKVNINGEYIKFDKNPIIENDRVLVPMRSVFEAIGANVVWQEESKSIIVTKNSKTIIMQIGSKTISINEKQVEIDVSPKIENGRTLIPIRAISETLGAKVNWNSDSNCVEIII